MFSKDIEKCCEYCEHSEKLKSGEAVICQKKKAFMMPNGRCASYRYSPLKRSPANRD